MTRSRGRVILRRGLVRAIGYAAAITSLNLLVPAAASALTFHWIGGTTGNWNDPLEWDTVEPGGSEAAWPSTAGDIAVFPATIATTVTVTIPNLSTAVVGELQILTNSNVTIQRTGTGVMIINTLSAADNGDIVILGTGAHTITSPIRIDRDLTVQVSNAASSLVFGAGIFELGARSFNKTGAGLVRFGATVSNTYSGATTVLAGVLELMQTGGATAIAGPLFVGTGAAPPNNASVRSMGNQQIADPSNVTVRGDGTFLLNGFAETIAVLTIEDGTLTMGATGDMIVSGLTMTGGTINLGAAGSTFVLQGNVTATSSALAQALIASTGGTFSLGGAHRSFAVSDGPAPNDLVINAPIIGVAVETLFKDGAGRMVMGGGFANNYAGFTTVRDGRLDLNKTVAPAINGDALIIGDGVGAANSAELRLMAGNQIADSVAVDVHSDGLLEMNSFGEIINTLLVDAGNVHVGPLTDLRTGAIHFIGGTISIGPSGALRPNGSVIFATSTAAQTATINGSGAFHLNGATRSLSVSDGPQAIDLRIDANIAGSGTEILAKTGPGAALLTGTGTYAGDTVIGEGTLFVNGFMNPAAYMLVSATTATLGGTGSVGSTSVGAGRIAPGLSPGILTSHGLAIGAGHPLAIELNGTTAGSGYDQMRVIGQAYISLAVLELTVGAGFTPPPASTFTIIDNDGTDPINGAFAGLDEGATVVASGHPFRISYAGGDGNDVVLTHIGEISYYLAEGATGAFFDNDVLIANPNLDDAPVRLTFLLEGGATVVENRTVAAQSRMTISVDALDGLGSASASVQVTSTSGLPLVVERTMSWDSTHYGGHTANAVTNPATHWVFAEGFQGFFDTYVLIANATATPAIATLTFLRESEAPFTTAVEVGAFSRKTVHAGDYPDLLDRAFGIVVDSTVPVIAERAMYFASVPGKLWGGGHVNTGTTTPSMTWFHAEGATGTFFNTFILLSNPFSADAHVTLQFLLQSGEVIERLKTVPANQRLTINPATEGDPRLENGSMSTVVTSDVPIVSERSMYWPGDASPFGEGHNSAGIVSTALRWGLAEGRVGGPLAYDTYILLTNATAGAADVKVTFLREGGATPVVKNYSVPATSRFNIDVRSMVPEIVDESFGALIESTSVNIAVERSLYWTANGIFWAGGTNALGTPLP